MSIYIIRSIQQSLADIYVGSCKDMRKRMITHKSNCYNEKRKEYNLKVYQFIRANGGWSNFVMEEIDTCDVERLYQMEQEYIDKLNPSLNSQRAYNTEEYIKENNKERHKEWRDKNKEYIKEKKKEWYENNKEYIKEQRKEYREKNKDKINERVKEKFTCECGGRYTRNVKTRHLRTKKHKSFISNNE